MSAVYGGATTRYDHLVLGRDHNWSQLRVTLSDGASLTLHHAEAVFEDTAPRLVDLDGDDAPELIVVESLAGQGARLAIYGTGDEGLALLAATPFIGRGYRWLAPVGAGDLDGDGRIEIAYVDRPHLRKTLRVWRFHPDGAPSLRPVADLGGVTNHRIGAPIIEGGIRICDDPQGTPAPEMILASDDWRHVRAVRFDGHTLVSRDVGPYTGPLTAQTYPRCP